MQQPIQLKLIVIDCRIALTVSSRPNGERIACGHPLTRQLILTALICRCVHPLYFSPCLLSFIRIT